MVFLQSELRRQGKGKESSGRSGRSSGAADCQRGGLEELNRIYESDSAVVPKGLFGRDDLLATYLITKRLELDSREAASRSLLCHDPRLRPGKDRRSVLIHVDAELSQSRWNLRRANDKAIPNQAPEMVGGKA